MMSLIEIELEESYLLNQNFVLINVKEFYFYIFAILKLYMLI